MDKQFIGKWYCTKITTTLDIMDEEPPRLKMSHKEYGHYNVEPNCIYEKNGYLCYEINDEQNRAIYYLRLENGKIVGYFSQYGKTADFVFDKISDIPEDKPYEYIAPKRDVPNTGMTRLEVLKKYSAYDRNNLCECAHTFFLGEALPVILEKYGYSEYIKGVDGNSDEIAFRLMNFVCDNFSHDGMIGHGNNRTLEGMIEFCENHNMYTNCRGLSIMLAALLRANGIKARHLTCMPYEEPCDDCHVVVDCILPSGERVMLDPTWRAYFKDEDGRYISIQRLRELIINEKPFYVNENAGRNKGSFDYEWYREYMTKNTFRFGRFSLHKDGIDYANAESRYYELIPTEYDTSSFSGDKSHFVYNDIEFWKM